MSPLLSRTIWITSSMCLGYFFFNDIATIDIYTLSLHDALPISAPVRDDAGQRGRGGVAGVRCPPRRARTAEVAGVHGGEDRKSTRLNSSHSQISYAVFCLKKKIGEHLFTENYNSNQLVVVPRIH